MSELSQEEVYIDYLNYDWDSFEEFNTGLKEILDNYLASLQEQDASVTSIPALDRQQLVDQAKSFFYCSHTGNIINLDDYEKWKRQYGSMYDQSKVTKSVEPKIEEIKPVSDNEKKLDQKENNSSELKADDPPYSSNYQDLVEMIVSGKPVPGIKNIPDTVLKDQGSTSESKQRKKPWEKNQSDGNNTTTTTTNTELDL